jgi:hypothetical protein
MFARRSYPVDDESNFASKDIRSDHVMYKSDGSTRFQQDG